MTTVTKEAYWPAILADPTQYGQIETTDPEWNTRAACLFRVLENTLITTENATLVQQWEYTLGLSTNAAETLAGRKAAILYNMSCALPLNLGLLDKSLELLLGAGNFELLINNDTQTIKIGFGLSTTQSQIASVNALMERVVPKNLIIENEWINGLPFEYTPVEYLQGAGKQWINTKATGNETSEVLCTFERTSAENKAVYTQNSKASTGLLNCFVWGNSMANLRYDWGSKNYGNNKAYPGGWVTSVQSAAGATLNGVKIIEFDAAGTFTSAALVLFSNRAVIGAWTADNVRMSRWALKTAGKPVRDMVAALDPTGAPCMYDLVTRTPYYNDSKVGDFAYPNMEQQSTTYSLRRRDYAQITEHGIRRLYHVPKGCELSKEEYAEQNGFKLLIETPAPEAGYWVPKLTETADAIIIEWAETEAPAEEAINTTEEE